MPTAADALKWVGLQQQRNARDASLALLATFALGTLVGGVLGLLFAPQTGPELQTNLGERLGEAGERIKETLTPTPGNGKAQSAA